MGLAGASLTAVVYYAYGIGTMEYFGEKKETDFYNFCIDNNSNKGRNYNEQYGYKKRSN